MGAFLKGGVVWYRVRALYGDKIEEWKASELREAPEIFSLAGRVVTSLRRLSDLGTSTLKRIQKERFQSHKPTSVLLATAPYPSALTYVAVYRR